MKRLLLVRGARQLLTLRGLPEPRRGDQAREIGLITDGAVLIENGRIHCVGPSRRLENLALARKAVEIPAHGCVVMPGFVDPLASLVAVGRSGDPGRMRRATGEGVQRFLCLAAGSGTTTAGLWVTFDPDSGVPRLARSLSEAPKVAAKASLRISVRAEQAGPAIALLERPALAGATPDGIAVGPAWWVGRGWHRFRTLGNRNFPNTDEENSPIDWLPYQPTALELSRGLHPVESSAWAAASTIAVASPAVHFESGSDFRFVRGALDAGIALALASAYDRESSHTYIMPFLMALATRTGSLRPEEAVVSATINAAFALGCADHCGSLEAGKRADLVILNTPDYRDLTRSVGVNLIGATIIRGELYSQPEVPWQASLLNAFPTSRKAAIS